MESQSINVAINFHNRKQLTVICDNSHYIEIYTLKYSVRIK